MRRAGPPGVTDVPPSVPPIIRRHFARGLVAAGGLAPGEATGRVEDAFAAVPRERHAGPGPWRLIAERGVGGTWRTPNGDPAWLYHDVLIALDTEAGINIGAPSMWARLFAALDVRPGERVAQIGAGTGYYTAILAHLVGPGGAVRAWEIEPHLAERAAAALRDVPNAGVVAGNGATAPPSGPHDLLVAFAGVTHPVPAWTEALAEGGRMLLPVTGTNGWGAFVLFQRETADRFALRTLGRCGFYPCAGARDEALAARWDLVLTGEATRGLRAVMERGGGKGGGRGGGDVALPGGWAVRDLKEADRG